jgi:tripartite-type tricarboxylate transporter receptor subunit TctC
VKDFAPITYVGYVPNVLVVNPALPAKSVADLIALAKARPRGLSFASPGVGITNHLAGELLKLDSGAPLVHVPYKGSAPAILDLLGNQVDMNFDAMPSIVPYLKTGRMRALAVTTPKRDPDLPDVPTMAELGFTTFAITNWYGVVAPTGTPTSIVEKLHGEISKILQMPDVIPQLAELGARREQMSVEQFAQFIRSENTKYRDIAKRTGVRME